MTTIFAAPQQTTRCSTDRKSPTDWFVVTANESHTDGLHAMFEAMSPESRRFRFFQAMPRVRHEVIRRLCAVDQQRHRSWLTVTTAGEVVGEVRAVLSAHGPQTTPRWPLPHATTGPAAALPGS